MRVMIVDDEPGFARPLAERLVLRGIKARVALDAAQALAVLAGEEQDLIFLDVGLPGMDGVALLKILRERHPGADVVMLSGAADMGKAVQAMRRGALNWLSKPVSMKDVLTECRKASERAAARREAARMAEAARWRSLGRVAEGVAHEVNNPLNIIVQAAGLIRDCLDEAEEAGKAGKTPGALPDLAEARQAVQTIHDQSLRVREITRKLLMVGHGLDERTRPLDAAAEIRGALALLQDRLVAAKVVLDLHLPGCGQDGQAAGKDAGGPRPLGSAPELRQICLHLLENALDAMPQGGFLKITSQIRRGGQGREWYDLYFADSGHGIPPEALPHIFEPFYSTRALCAGGAGRYAGLGLAVARSLAHARGGELTAAPGEKGGAVFRLSLPLAEALAGTELADFEKNAHA